MSDLVIWGFALVGLWYTLKTAACLARDWHLRRELDREMEDYRLAMEDLWRKPR